LNGGFRDFLESTVARGSTTPVPEPLPASTSGEGTGAPIELSEQARYVLENTVARTLKLKVQ
jgi:hypothetical protein